MTTAADFAEHLGADALAAMLSVRMEALAANVARGDWMAVLRNADAFAALFPFLLSHAAQNAFNEGATKRAIAEALGVSPATFRGMVRT